MNWNLYEFNKKLMEFKRLNKDKNPKLVISKNKLSQMILDKDEMIPDKDEDFMDGSTIYSIPIEISKEDDDFYFTTLN